MKGNEIRISPKIILSIYLSTTRCDHSAWLKAIFFVNSSYFSNKSTNHTKLKRDFLTYLSQKDESNMQGKNINVERKIKTLNNNRSNIDDVSDEFNFCDAQNKNHVE